MVSNLDESPLMHGQIAGFPIFLELKQWLVVHSGLLFPVPGLLLQYIPEPGKIHHPVQNGQVIWGFRME